jgi:exopolyphosphatase/guanosine-5'-triphosphate,3'-diphosphate pyrophosphatase
MRLAVLDLGLDSLHLAVFETDGRAAGALFARRSWTENLGLGATLADGATLGDAAIARALAAVQRLLRDVSLFDPACPLIATASAALCAVEGGAALREEIGLRHGVAVEPLSCESEARLSYLGARSFVGNGGRLAVIDLGGRSLELATGAGVCDLVFSVPLGVLNLRDIYLYPERGLDRAARDRVAATVRFAAADAARAVWDRRPERLAFTSGTALALGALADELGLRSPGERALSVAALGRLADILAQFRPIELPALGVEEARSDSVAVGAVVLHTVMELLNIASAAISPWGRREGAALRHLRGLDAGSPMSGELTQVHTAVT